MKLIKKLENSLNEFIGYVAYCPGCKFCHAIYTEGAAKPHPIWVFNGDAENPTFKPSLLVRYGAGSHSGAGRNVCHSHIINGQWRFLQDSTHALAGQTVDMVDVDSKSGK